MLLVLTGMLLLLIGLLLPVLGCRQSDGRPARFVRGASSAASFPSDTATESRFPIRGNPENEIASFQGLRP